MKTAELGNDLTFGYVHVFDSSEVAIDENAFAKGGYGNIFRCTLLSTNQVAVAKVIFGSTKKKKK